MVFVITVHFSPRLRNKKKKKKNKKNQKVQKESAHFFVPSFMESSDTRRDPGGIRIDAATPRITRKTTFQFGIGSSSSSAPVAVPKREKKSSVDFALDTPLPSPSVPADFGQLNKVIL